ncbi:hypothetical protein FLACHUCJ7_01853 [Flavobacterium chungangense]|uniref:Uncharacterized protein n=2 Tax=Flavobacterium TaxID=237 RepID=A0A6V6Z0G9_9FLAO|nr:hypothetical protein FLACHUCJ7_01853 [Flavobacterium chungangense]CAD0008051.1 hypothetical protein FLAT13_04170 [Flavobacterium salmonis]
MDIQQINCSHREKKIKVLDAVCGCETTVIVCCDCEKELTEPKTEC